MIYITGIAGLIGSNLAKKLLELGYNIKGCDNLIEGYKTNIPNSNRLTWDKLDINDNAKLTKSMQDCEIVIHTACLAAEGLSIFSPSLITNSIYSGTVSMASAAIQNKVKLIINLSSMASYGNANGLGAPFKEDMIRTPEDPYGMAKLHAEDQLNLLSDIHGIKVFHLINHNVCGPNQVFDNAYRNVLSIFINRAINNKSIIVYGNGTQKRSFSHVNDSVDATITLMHNQDNITNKELFNIGPDDGTEITIGELAYKVFYYLDKAINIEFYPARPYEVKNAWVSTDKAKSILNYSASISIEDTIKDTINWIKKQKPVGFRHHLPIEIITEETPKTWTQKLM